MAYFVVKVNGFLPLNIITKHSIFDVAAALDPPLSMLSFRHNVRNIKGLAFEVNNAKGCNCFYKGTVFLYMILIEKIEFAFV